MNLLIHHKGLPLLYEQDDPRGVLSEHAEKLCDTLARLDVAGSAADMDLPSFRLHPRKGSWRGFLGHDRRRKLASNLLLR
jgi:toxin HigB-1